MDEAVIKYYRRLLTTGFEFAGSIENPSIFLDYDKTTGVLCGKTGNSLRLYINTHDGVIEEIKYICTCDPTVNVALEVLCTLVKGKTTDEAENLSEQEFFRVIGSQSEDLQKKVKALKELLNIGISKYKEQTSSLQDKR